MTYICYYGDVKRTTLFIPDELHERLRQEAFRARVSMAELVRSRLESRVKAKKRPKDALDPLLKVAGLWDGPPLSVSIDEELYGI
jgi:hypothetical protein